MAPESGRWGRLAELIDGALALPPDSREAWLKSATATEPGLFERVVTILALEETESTGFRKAVGNAAGSLDWEAELEPGERIGPYRVVRQIGKGGMGVVYEAARCDDEFSQAVAIKLIARGAESPQLLRRFRAERKVLAGLNHPNIARIFDGGTTGDGRPYFVMELIDGRPVVEYCSERNISIGERLSLFVDVCSAVQHAHERMIVHRDIKPGNILVTGEGVPKLLDFGIAKALDEAEATVTGAQLMTPEYASPEQVRGDDVTAATDVYALGAVLYELLTGQKPHRFKDRSAVEIARTICDVEPQRPSAVAPELHRQLAGDLDNIVLMALRKEPERRYPSVRQFAEDIQRSLTDRPVAARADTLRYRTLKFAQRNWWQLIAVAAVILSLSAGLGFTLAAQRRTNRRFAQVRQLANRFLFDFHDAIANTPGTLKAREMVVSTALQYLNSLSADAAGDPALQWELAVAYGKVAKAQGYPSGPSLGRVTDAIVSYEKAFQLARPLARQNRLDAHQKEILMNMLVEAEFAYFNVTRFDDAVSVAREAVQVSAALTAPMQRMALNQLSTALAKKGDLLGALEARERTLPIMREVTGRDPSVSNKNGLAGTLSNLGYFKDRLTRFDDALADEREALSLLRSMEGQQKDIAAQQHRLLTAYFYIGLIEGAGDRPSMGNARAAQHDFEQGLKEIGVLIDADSHDYASRSEAGNTHLEIAYALLETAPEEALQHAKLAGTLVDIGSADVSDVRAQPRTVEGDAYRRLKQFAKAEGALKESERILTVFGTIPEAELELAWANLEADRGNREVAAVRYGKAIGKYETLFAKAVTPASAWGLTQALTFAGAGDPVRRQRILAVWTELSQKYPKTPYIEERLKAAAAGN
jgi:tetratricopeptide (TPR) repeat protein